MPSVCCLSCPVCLSVTFVHCGQTVGRIKTKLGMRVGFGSGHFVLDVLFSKGVDVRISTMDRKCGTLAVVAIFVALEQQITLVKTRSEWFRNGGDITD